MNLTEQKLILTRIQKVWKEWNERHLSGDDALLQIGNLLSKGLRKRKYIKKEGGKKN